MRSFLAVAKHKSFTLAAEELFLTQSAVSQQIRALEAELGTSLFMRERHAVELTDAGRTLAPQARNIVRLLDETRALVSGPKALRGTVRIAAATVASSYLYVPLYERFARSYPEVGLEITNGVGRDEALARIRSGDADAAFMQFPLEADDVDQVVLGTTDIVAVACTRERTTRLMLWDASPELARTLAEAGTEIAVRTNDLALLKRLVDDGAGTAFMPKWAVKSELDAGAFILVPFDFLPVRQRFGIVYARAERSPAVAAFLATANDYKATLIEIAR